MRAFVTSVLLVIGIGCSHQRNASTEVNRALYPAKVLSIARQAVATNETWAERAEFETPQHDADGSTWTVTVWRLPKTPGGFRLIRIDERGKVTDYIHGH